jgi:hypothetical protein
VAAVREDGAKRGGEFLPAPDMAGTSLTKLT